MNVRALDSVEADLDRITQHLERERSGWGFKFMDAYDRIYETIERLPQLYPPAEDSVPSLEIRNAIFDRFDYRVIYLVKPDEAVILTVAHTSRRPEHWHRRLTDPGV